MKKTILMLCLSVLCLSAVAQSPVAKVADGKNKAQQQSQRDVKLPYNEQEDAVMQIDMALEEANASQRYVLAQVGGNWCPWCVRFAQFADTNAEVHALIEKNFVFIHVNYSKGNKNLEAMKRLGNPGRFGYPVFVILNRDGEVLHIQNSAYLEEGKGYSEKKVLECFANWTEEAIETIK